MFHIPHGPGGACEGSTKNPEAVSCVLLARNVMLVSSCKSAHGCLRVRGLDVGAKGSRPIHSELTQLFKF